MPDRRQNNVTTAEEIAQAKIDAITLRDGDPSKENVERAIFAILQKKYGGRAQEATLTNDSGSAAEATPEETAPAAPVETATEVAEVAPEVLTRCKEQLKRDFDRGIVCIEVEIEDDEGKKEWIEASPDQCSAAFKADKTAGQSWEGDILPQLEADNNSLLKRATRLQGMGELVGVDRDGNILIISRGDEDGSREPERFGFRANQVEIVGGKKQPKQGEKPTHITTDTLDRDDLMREIEESGLWGDSIDIRGAVKAMGLEMPPDAPDYIKKGLVAAVEAVTGDKFVKGRGNTYVDAVMNFEHSSRGADVRVVDCTPRRRNTDVRYDKARNRYDDRGAVCVLRGSKTLET